jgi:hypothetical protein
MGVGEDQFVVRLCCEEAEREVGHAKLHHELEALAAVRRAQ